MLDALTLDQLRSFVAVADSGSFRSAARRLLRVQSAISHAVANLEAQLGVPLFERSGRRPALTPEGQALLADARDILLRMDALRAHARGLGEGVERELSLVVDTLFPISQVGAALCEVRSAFPAVDLRVTVAPLGGPIQALMDGRCTLAVTVGETVREPRLALEALSSVALVAVVAGTHPLGRRSAAGPLGLTDLADHLQVVLEDPTELTKGRSFGVLSPHVCRVGTQDVKHALILAGVGWGRLPLWQVARDLDEGRLSRLATDALGRRAELVSEAYLVHRVDEPLGPAARAFRTALSRIAKAAAAEGGTAAPRRRRVPR